MLLEEGDKSTCMLRGAQCFTCCGFVVVFLSIKANIFLKPYSEFTFAKPNDCFRTTSYLRGVF